MKKPWGEFIQVTTNQKSTVKIISIKQRHRTSLQSHQCRDEIWFILKGRFNITINHESIIAIEGMEFYVKRGEKHRIEGLDKDNKLLEVSLGNFDENDICRFEDDYGR